MSPPVLLHFLYWSVGRFLAHTFLYLYIYMLLTDQWADFWPRPSFSIPTCHLLICGQIPSPHMFYTYMLINDQWADFWPKHFLYLYASYWSFVRFRAHAFSIPTGICYILVFCQISSPRFCIPICYLMICWQISGPGILYTYMLLTDQWVDFWPRHFLYRYATYWSFVRFRAHAISIPICHLLICGQISGPGLHVPLLLFLLLHHILLPFWISFRFMSLGGFWIRSIPVEFYFQFSKSINSEIDMS